MLSTRNRSLGALVRVVLTAGLALASVVDAEEGLRLLSHGDDVLVVNLTEKTTILDRLPFATTPVASLKAGNDDALHGLRARGVYADLSGLSVDQVAAEPVFRAALAGGVPIVLENVDDPRTMGEIAGLGIPTLPGQAVVLQRLEDGRTLIALAGQVVEGSAGPIESLAVSDDAFGHPAPPAPDDEEPLTFEPEAGEKGFEGVDPELVATLVTEVLTDPSRLAWEVLKGLDAGSAKSGDVFPQCPEESCRQWLFVQPGQLEGNNRVFQTFSPPGGGGIFDVGLTFVITLFDSLHPSAKHLSIQTDGHVANRLMFFNADKVRGYFMEGVTIESELIDTRNGAHRIELSGTSPVSVNGTTSVTTGEGIGFEVGVDADGPSAGLSYTTSWSSTRNIRDFEVLNQAGPFAGIGARAKWRYDMATVLDNGSGHPYSSWTDLVNSGCQYKLYQLPAIARSTLQPNTLSTWTVNRAFKGWGRFRNRVTTRTRMTWLSTRSFICTLSYTVYTRSYSAIGAADFWVRFDDIQ